MSSVGNFITNAPHNPVSYHSFFKKYVGFLRQFSDCNEKNTYQNFIPKRI